jgi:hypothetical protein
MNKKETYLWPKRCQHFLGPFLCSSSYDGVSVACAFCFCPVLIIPLIVHCCHHLGHVVSLFISVCIPVIILWCCLSLSCDCFHCHLPHHVFVPSLLLLLLLFFIVVPSLSLPCQLLISTPQAGAFSSGIGVGVPSCIK